MTQLLTPHELDQHYAAIDEEFHKRFLFYKPTPKQIIFHNAGLTAVERLFLAGNRTGKTFAALMELGFHLTGYYPNWYEGYRIPFAPTVWSCAISLDKVSSVLQKGLFGDVTNGHKGIIHNSLVVRDKITKIKNTYHTIPIKHISGNHSLLEFKTFLQGESSFQSNRLHFIHGDEQMPYDVYIECLARLMDVDGKGQGKIAVTAYPSGGVDQLVAHFMHRRELIEKNGLKQEEMYIIPPEEIINRKFYMHASWDDNPHLTEETKETMRKAYKPHELEAREKGIPTIGEGMVYQIPESVFVIDPINIPSHFSCFNGMDVGWEDPTAVVMMAHDRENDVIYVYKEYKLNHQTPETHASLLAPQGLNWIPTICDPASNMRSQDEGVTILSKYRAAGIPLIKGKRTRETSIQEIMQRINTDRFKIFSNCRKLLDEWRVYSRDINGKVINGNDHLMNALEYGILEGTKYAKTKNEYTNEIYKFKSKVALI